MHQALKKSLLTTLFIAAVSTLGNAQAADLGAGILGKNEWLYYRYELAEPTDTATTNVTIDLIQRLNQVLARNGVTLAVTMVPIKMRIHPENLPPDVPLTPTMAANYERIAKQLRAANVHVLDLNTPFLNSPKRTSDTPLFIRLDTHWSPAGALLAAESIRSGIDANPALKKILDAIPEEKFNFAWGAKKIVSKGRDLVAQLPKGTPANFGQEQILPFFVTRAAPPKENLLGESAAPGVVLMGSSYSDTWTGFGEALRFTLQRDLLDISVGADRGSWVGLETYLRDEAFQTQKPKLLIWELPERDMKALPDYQYREARYKSDNNEWLLRAATWIESTCAPSPVTAKFEATGVGAIKGAELSVGATTPEQFIDISFSGPLGPLDYISTSMTASGTKAIVLEAGAGAAARKFNMTISDDGAPHAFKTPLPASGGNAAGFAKVRIFPGKAKSFALKDLKVCRLPDGLLK